MGGIEKSLGTVIAQLGFGPSGPMPDKEIVVLDKGGHAGIRRRLGGIARLIEPSPPIATLPPNFRHLWIQDLEGTVLGPEGVFFVVKNEFQFVQVPVKFQIRKAHV